MNGLRAFFPAQRSCSLAAIGYAVSGVRRLTVTLRIGQEYLAQGVSFAVTMMDRVLIAAVLLRMWGVEQYASWTLALSAMGMVAIFDLGLNAYFSNRLAMLVAKGRHLRALRAYRAGTWLMAGAFVAGGIVVFIGFGLYLRYFSGIAASSRLWEATGLLLVGAVVRLALSMQYYLYRAHNQFARQTLLSALGDFSRVVFVVGAALSGFGLVATAAAYLLASVLSTVPVLMMELPRRFPRFSLALEMPNRPERRHLRSVAFAYWLQSACTTLLLFLPVFIIYGWVADVTVVAQFVLVRTLSNFVRTGQQLLALVLGQEAARRLAIGDKGGLWMVFRDGGNLLAVQSGCAVGMILALGGPLFALWTGRPGLYVGPLLAVAMLPVAAAPTLLLTFTVFLSANRPLPILIGRLIQVAAAVVGFFLLPIVDPALRMMTALSLAEIFGFGIPVALGLKRLVPQATLTSYLRSTARGALGGIVTYAGAVLAYDSMRAPFALPLGLAAALAAGLAMTALLGIERHRRIVLVSLVGQRLLGAARPRTGLPGEAPE